MKRNILICYDTPSPKRRTKIANILSKYGTRVNYSVFELIISDTKRNNLEKDLLSLLKPKEDSLRIYHICENCLYKSKSLCDDKEPFLPPESLILWVSIDLRTFRYHSRYKPLFCRYSRGLQNSESSQIADSRYKQNRFTNFLNISYIDTIGPHRHSTAHNSQNERI